MKWKQMLVGRPNNIYSNCRTGGELVVLYAVTSSSLWDHGELWAWQSLLKNNKPFSKVVEKELVCLKEEQELEKNSDNSEWLNTQLMHPLIQERELSQQKPLSKHDDIIQLAWYRVIWKSGNPEALVNPDPYDKTVCHMTRAWQHMGMGTAHATYRAGIAAM